MSYKEKKRERRRRDLIRMKSKSIRVAKIQSSLQFFNEDEHCNVWRLRLINRAVVQAEYMAVCSCSQCGNGRRYFGYRTRAEKRFLQYLKD